ncbi:hypothetical protein MRB53_037508 [Persea americana]|nr:hypothetical protein MRB53_037508 [Persea americana]
MPPDFARFIRRTPSPDNARGTRLEKIPEAGIADSRSGKTPSPTTRSENTTASYKSARETAADWGMRNGQRKGSFSPKSAYRQQACRDTHGFVASDYGDDFVQFEPGKTFLYALDLTKATLDSCWTTCRMFASISSSYQDSLFRRYEEPAIQRQAWHSCWALCQHLYDQHSDAKRMSASSTLDLCRDFCLALFKTRHATQEPDVLKISFDLNSHLYDLQDPTSARLYTKGH